MPPLYDTSYAYADPTRSRSRALKYNDVYYDTPNMRRERGFGEADTSKSPDILSCYEKTRSRNEIPFQPGTTIISSTPHHRTPQMAHYLPKLRDSGSHYDPYNYYNDRPFRPLGPDYYDGKRGEPQPKFEAEIERGPAASAGQPVRYRDATEPVVVEAAFDYDPAYMSPNDAEAAKEELPFRTGDRIQVLSGLDPDGFFVGRRLDNDEVSRAEGLVPSNMVTGPVPLTSKDISTIRRARSSFNRRDQRGAIPSSVSQRSTIKERNGVGTKAPTPGALATASDTDASVGSSSRPQRRSSLTADELHDANRTGHLPKERHLTDSGSLKRERPRGDGIQSPSQTSNRPITSTIQMRGAPDNGADPQTQRRLSGQDSYSRARLSRSRSSKGDQPSQLDSDLPGGAREPSTKHNKQHELVSEPDKDFHQAHGELGEIQSGEEDKDNDGQREENNQVDHQYLNIPSQPQPTSRRESITGVPIKSSNNDSNSGPTKRMIALFDYDPRILSPNVDSDLELSFKTGDIILVEGDMDPDGFYVGRLGNMQGLVPSNFLKELPPLPEEDPSFYDLPRVQKTKKSKGSSNDLKNKLANENTANKSRRPISGTQSAHSSPRNATRGGLVGNQIRNMSNVATAGHSNHSNSGLAGGTNDGQNHHNESGFFSNLLKFTPKS